MLNLITVREIEFEIAKPKNYQTRTLDFQIWEEYLDFFEIYNKVVLHTTFERTCFPEEKFLMGTFKLAGKEMVHVAYITNSEKELYKI